MTKALDGIRVIDFTHDQAGPACTQMLMRALAGRGIPCGAVLDTAEVLDDPHLRERGTVFDLEHPTRGRFAMIGSPVRLSGSPLEVAPAPRFGEHTEEVLRTLAGGTDEDVRRMRERGVIG